MQSCYWNTWSANTFAYICKAIFSVHCGSNVFVYFLLFVCISNCLLLVLIQECWLTAHCAAFVDSRNQQLMASAVAALKPPSGTVPYNIVISCFLGARLQTSIGPDSWCSLSVGGCSSVVTCVASWGFVVNSSGKDAEKVMQWMTQRACREQHHTECMCLVRHVRIFCYVCAVLSGTFQHVEIRHLWLSRLPIYSEVSRLQTFTDFVRQIQGWFRIEIRKGFVFFTFSINDIAS